MLFHSITTLVCALSIVAHAAASPTKRDVDISIDNILYNATVKALDQRDDLIVRVDVDASKRLSTLAPLLVKFFIGDVLDDVNFLSQKRDDGGSLVSIDIGVDNLLNNASISVMSQ
ncbi:hypothetical protein BD769DRAFT_1664782 [Suillus cothurnatus]|nr:hypothetical protein BD769DRAFT_1664782 [Suillus cothurnatus]